MAHIINEEAENGPTALLQGYPEFEKGDGKVLYGQKGAILIFMPGAMEIGRMARRLSGEMPTDYSDLNSLSSRFSS